MKIIVQNYDLRIQLVTPMSKESGDTQNRLILGSVWNTISNQISPVLRLTRLK